MSGRKHFHTQEHFRQSLNKNDAVMSDDTTDVGEPFVEKPVDGTKRSGGKAMKTYRERVSSRKAQEQSLLSPRTALQPLSKCRQVEEEDSDGESGRGKVAQSGGTDQGSQSDNGDPGDRERSSVSQSSRDDCGKPDDASITEEDHNDEAKSEGGVGTRRASRPVGDLEPQGASTGPIEPMQSAAAALFRSETTICEPRGTFASAVIEYSTAHSSFPTIHTVLADPVYTLRFYLEPHIDRLHGVYRTATSGIMIAAGGGAASSGGSDTGVGKGGGSGKLFASLRRKKTQMALSDSGDAPTPAQRAPELSKYANELAHYLAPSDQSRDRLVMFQAEVARLLADFAPAHTHFVNCLCCSVNLAQRAIRGELEKQSAFVMLDQSVVQHVLLRDLNIPDNRIFYEIGCAALTAHVYTVTFLHGFNADVAQRRIAAILDGTHIWLTKRFGDSALAMLPLMWQVDATGMAQMSEADVRRHQDMRLRRIVPIWLGLLDVMALQYERNKLLVEMLKTFV
jgi:hypothetical protein